MQSVAHVQGATTERLLWLDVIRSADLLSMILYHMTWDLVHLCGVSLSWYGDPAGYLWQQSICWIFILLSGFCWSLGHHPLRRGLTVLGASLLVSLVTCLILPEERIVFGILTFLGAAMLLMVPLERLLRHAPAVFGIVVSAGLFVLCRNINDGMLGFEAWEPAAFPEALYRNSVTTFLGFQEAGFFSTDYFSLLPWFFLFLTGYFLYRLLHERGVLSILSGEGRALRLFAVPGRHSLLIYLLHQPVLYGILMMLF